MMGSGREGIGGGTETLNLLLHTAGCLTGFERQVRTAAGQLSKLQGCRSILCCWQGRGI